MPTRASRAETLAQRLLDAQVAYHLSLLDDDRLAQTTAQALTELLEHLSGTSSSTCSTGTPWRRPRFTCFAPSPAAAAHERRRAGHHGAPRRPRRVLPPRRRGRPRPGGRAADLRPAAHPALERGSRSWRTARSPGSSRPGSWAGSSPRWSRPTRRSPLGCRVWGRWSRSGRARRRGSKGAADKQFESLLGDTVGKGGTYAVRRLNKIVVDTLLDPTTGEAALQVWGPARPPAGRGAGQPL